MRGEEMSPEELARERAFDERIVAELERAPDLSVSIPADFAQRVAARVPARRPVTVRATHYGRMAMWCSLLVLLVLLVAAATRGMQLATVVEWVLFAQFLGLAVWLGVRQWRAN
jgi:hypothetical protein